jgi:hypothetical protein
MRHLALTTPAFVLLAIDAFAQAGGISLPTVARTVVTDPMAPQAGGQGLSLTLGVSETYDQVNLTPGLQPAAQNGASPVALPVYLRSGFHTRGNAALNYSYDRQGERSSFFATANSRVSMYSSSSRAFTSVGTAIGGSWPLGRRTSFNAAQTFSFAPYHNFGLFPASDPALEASLGASTVPNINYAAASRQTYRYGLTTGLTRSMSKRSSFGLSYGATYTDFRDAAVKDLIDQHAAVRYTHSLSQGLSLHLGYGYGIGSYGSYAANPIRRETHNIDIGADYSKALSFSRRTTFGFSTGSGLMTRSGAASQSLSGSTDFRFTGAAHLNYQLGRTWSAQLAYRRGWNFVEGFSDPLFNDAVTAGLGGQLNPRTSAAVSASYLYGSMGYSGQRHDSVGGTSMLRLRLRGSAVVYAQYVYYRYEFPGSIVPQTGFPTFFERNGARVGFSVGIPLIRQ